MTFLNHASVLISGDNVSVLSDPWFSGEAFHKGWNLLYENPQSDIINILKNTTHIWISHEHPDHFSINFFKEYGKTVIELNIIILFQETNDKRVVNFLKSKNFTFIELKFNKTLKLDKDFEVLCIKDGFYDSGLLVNNKNEKILNLNDCEINTKSRAIEVLKKTGTVDILLTQFSYAAWKGGEENKKWREEAANQKIETIKLQISMFKPKITIPFASFIFFSNELNYYLNDSSNNPYKVYSSLKNEKTSLIFMKPGDVLEKNKKPKIKDAINFWEYYFKYSNKRKLHKYKSVPEKILKENFQNYCLRIKNKNNIFLMKIARFLSPIKLFHIVLIYLTDINKTVEFDYLSGKFEYSNKKAQLSMHSESLNFIFSNSFGFDTLTVNGCLEENSKGGFVQSTKTLAIENLNNLGFYINLKLFLNLKLIKLFLLRLYKVSKKLI